MTVLIVGGDHVEPLKREILARGHARVEHWRGRKAGFARRALPGGTRLVVIICDYISHSLSNALKAQANRSGVPLIFCRCSANELRGKLRGMGETEGDCRRCRVPAIGETGTLRAGNRPALWRLMEFDPGRIVN